MPHTDVERARLQILDFRDELHGVLGRRSDRVQLEAWTGLAERLGLVDAEAAQRQVRVVDRRITHLSRLTWNRLDAVLVRSTAPARPRRPHLDRVAPGVAVSAHEVVLDSGTSPGRVSVLLLRAAVEAGLVADLVDRARRLLGEANVAARDSRCWMAAHVDVPAAVRTDPQVTTWELDDPDPDPAILRLRLDTSGPVASTRGPG